MVMLGLLGGLRNYLKTRKVHTDGNVFRLHTTGTVVLLLTFSLLLTTKELVGAPIDCYGSSVPKNVLDSFCWIESTYSVKTLFKLSERNTPVYPGVGKSQEGVRDRKYHVYYQWVFFLLFGQAICFYVPRWMWKIWEGGKLAAIVTSLDDKSTISQDKGDPRARVVDFLVLSLNRNNWYFVKYLLCELASVVNVITQMLFTDYVLGGGFLSYGSDVVEWHRETQHELVCPTVRSFPRVGMCSFTWYGGSGTVVNTEAVCVLPLNIVNEKVFLVLWFWYILLLITSAFGVVYRLLLATHAPLRCRLLQARYPGSKSIGDVVRTVSLGDVFLLSLIGQNVNSIVFGDIVNELSHRLGKDLTRHTCETERNIVEA